MKKPSRKKDSPKETALFWVALASVFLPDDHILKSRPAPPKQQPETIDVEHTVIESKLNKP